MSDHTFNSERFDRAIEEIRRLEELDQPYYKIVFRQDGTLAAACMQSFDEYDYDIAVNRRFENETEARLIALALNNITNPAEMLRAVQELENG